MLRTSFKSIPNSRAIFLATGDAIGRFVFGKPCKVAVCSALGAAAFGASVVSCFGCSANGAGVLTATGAPFASKIAIVAPTSTVSPGSPSNFDTIPESSAMISTLTLSVSSSTTRHLSQLCRLR